MSDSDCLTLSLNVLFEVMVVKAACLESCVVNMQSHSYDLEALC